MKPSAPSQSGTRLGTLIIANILIPIAVLVFATGFFPYKPFLSGLSTFEEAENEEHGLGLLSKETRPERVFDKVIFMVVDALRSDFVYGHGSGFVFTQSLIRTGAAIPFTAHAAPPTVTMPRVKGLTSGSVPSFLDLILNFAESDTSSSLAMQDTWLAQVKAHLRPDGEEQGKVIFYGDDTWLKLFPDFFSRAEGTSSFFVSDFTEVDNNVTRHVPRELQQPDWNAMIMHYLGLDHIGHKSGPLSPNMFPKQQEMDGIVETIYEAIDSLPHLQNALLVLAGDHGMNSAGNHGGSAAGETSPALVFISPKLRRITCDNENAELPAAEEDSDERLGIQPPVSPAALFATEQKGKMARVNTGAAQHDLVKYLTEIWDAMDPQDKAIYEDLAARDQLRYQKEREKAIFGQSVLYQAPTEPKVGTEFEYYRQIEQSDLVPTLAALLGMPVSRNNLGIIVPEMLKFWQNDQAESGLRSDHQLLYRNSLQVLKILKAAYGDAVFDDALKSNASPNSVDGAEACKDMAEGAEQLSCMWSAVNHCLLRLERGEKGSAIEFVLTDFLATAQRTLSAAASSYDVTRLIAGTAIALLATILAVVSKNSVWPPSTAGLVLAAIIALYGIMMFATSYVEEEQHFWYWVTGAWIVLLYFIRPAISPIPSSMSGEARTNTAQAAASSNRTAAIAVFLLLAAHRVTTRWNQTGQKHAGAPDIAHHYFPAHHIIMWILVLATYLHLGFRLALRAFSGLASYELSMMTALSLTIPSLIFKLNFTQADAPELVQGLAKEFRAFTAQWDLVSQARATFAGLAVAAVALFLLSWLRERWLSEEDEARVVTLSQRLHDLLTLFLITQTRVQNIPLFLLFELQLQMLYPLLTPPLPTVTKPPQAPTSEVTISATQPQTVESSSKIPPYKPPPILAATISILLLTHVSYFALGGSNAISSLDLSNAYNGIAGYNVLAVGILLFASNWAGPIWWSTAAVLLLQHLRDGPEPDIEETEEDKQAKNATSSTRRWVEEERSLLKASAAPPVVKQAKQEVRGLWMEHLATLTVFVCAGLVAVMAACTVLRTHLFIWTVFSPKYLYAMAWSLGWHFVVNVAIGSVLYRLGRR